MRTAAFTTGSSRLTPAHLPDAVVRTLNKRYPKAETKEVMAITAVNNGAEQLEGYEIVVRRTLRKDIEITIAPDGRILEGPGAQK